jgi:hypothetical protein
MRLVSITPLFQTLASHTDIHIPVSSDLGLFRAYQWTSDSTGDVTVQLPDLTVTPVSRNPYKVRVSFLFSVNFSILGLGFVIWLMGFGFYV